MSQVTANKVPDLGVKTAVEYKVLRRDNTAVDFDPAKISVAITKAFIAVEGESGGVISSKVRDIVQRLTAQICAVIERRLPDGGVLHLEHIQDQVELALMREGEHEVARSYVLYREARAKEPTVDAGPSSVFAIEVTNPDGSRSPLDVARLKVVIEEACANLG